MADAHISNTVLERFLFVELTPEETAPIINHLLTRCADCLARAEAVAARFGMGFKDGQFLLPKHPMNYEQAFRLTYARAFDEHPLRAAIAEQRIRARGLWSELVAHTHAERADILRSDPRFHHWGLFDRLLEEARAPGAHDPDEAAQLAELALLVRQQLRPEEYTEAFLHDLEADAWGVFGNAKRLATDFNAAADALVWARHALEDGSGDPVAEAQLISLTASLRADLGHFEEAAEMLNRAQELLIEVNDARTAARFHLQQGLYVGYTDPARGVTFTEEALVHLADAQDPRLELCGRINLILFLLESGRTQDAIAMLDFTRPLLLQFRGDPWLQLRIQTLEGRIARELGDLDGAVNTLRRVAHEFLKHNMRQEHVLASVHFMEALVATERYQDAIATGARVYKFLEGWNRHSELCAVWYLFHEAIEKRTFEESAFQAIAEYVQRWWHRPEVFQPPGE